MGKKRKDIFISRDFMLNCDAAEELYHEWARDLPIIDYRCRLPPEDMADDRKFRNLTEAWIAEDRDKWRAMRFHGVHERNISGDASDWEKFLAWSEVLPRCVGDKLHHLSHIELKRPLRIGDRLLDGDSARSIWEECNERLDEPGYTARGLLEQAQVLVVCTVDDPCASLEPHRRIARQGWQVQVRPTWNPDQGLAIDHQERFNAWIDRLGVVAGMEITDIDTYLTALRKRHDAFHSVGCRTSNHVHEPGVFQETSASQLKQIFVKARSGKSVSPEEASQFRSRLMLECGRMDHSRGWVQQLHLGVLRDINLRRVRLLGADAGFDAYVGGDHARQLSQYLDALDQTDQLPKTLVATNEPVTLDSLIGCFQDAAVPAKIQLGTSYWPNGSGSMRLGDFNMAQLSRSVGICSDTRTFLGYSRHEYFRRSLCDLLGRAMEDGRIPDDHDLVGTLVQDLCYRNAAQFFDFGLPSEPTDMPDDGERQRKRT